MDSTQAEIKKVQDGAEQGEHIIEVITKRASPIIREIMNRHEEKCLMKIDCEGAEYGIFEDLINAGCMEINLY